MVVGDVVVIVGGDDNSDGDGDGDGDGVAAATVGSRCRGRGVVPKHKIHLTFVQNR